MNPTNLRIEDIVPEDISKSPPTDIPFLFYRHQGQSERLLNRIAGHIEKMDLDSKNNLERTLNLQFITAPRDSHGNVCFADDPHLRSEYRTSFHPVDLWDYYYALWHSKSYYKIEGDRKRDLRLPHSDLFWSMVTLGSRLRNIHSSNLHKQMNRYKVSSSSDISVGLVEKKFQVDKDCDQKGILFLNEELYIENIPVAVWEFHLAGTRPLQEFVDHSGQYKWGKDQISALLRWIYVIQITNEIQVITDALLTNSGIS